MKPLAVTLISGGMDSCVAATIAARSHDLAALHLGYHQKTDARERRAFEDICNHFDVPHERRLISSSDFLRDIGGSALIDPDLEVHEAERIPDGVPATYVPFRNAHLLSMAVSWAEVLAAESIYVGIMEEDSAGYPDCSEAFTAAFQKAVQAGSTSLVRICTPLIHHKKSAVLKLGMDLGAPLQHTWSCYRNEEVACGTCDSCTARLRAFEEAGLKDPVEYS